MGTVSVTYPKNVQKEAAVNTRKDGSLKAAASNSFRAGRALARALVPLRRAGKARMQSPKAMNPIVLTAQAKPFDVVIRSKARINATPPVSC